MKKTLIITLLLVGAATAGFSQRSELGVFGGVSYYHGEMNPDKPFLLSKPAYGIVYRYNLNTRLALKANLLQGTLEGNGANAYIPTISNENFKTKIDELSLQLEFNYLKYFTGSKLSYFSPYIFGGASVFLFNPKASGRIPIKIVERVLKWNEWISDEGGPQKMIGFALPFGLGLKYSVSNLVGLSLEWGMRKTFNDYIDDVHGVYEWGEAPVNILQRGNSQDKDWYSFAGAMVTIKLLKNKRASCTEVDKVKF